MIVLHFEITRAVLKQIKCVILIFLTIYRKNQDVRLALLFQDDAQSFIGLYRERHTRMREFLSQIEEKATLLNKMKKGGNISSVTSSSVGVVGGIVSIVGLALAPVTAGVSLSLTISGISLGLSSGTTALVTGITKTTVKTRHGKNADKLFKRFEEDASELTKCLETASTIKTPHVQPDIGYLLAKSVQAQVKAGVLGKSIHGLQTSVKVARALRNGKVAKDLAKRTPLAMSKFARGGLIGLNVVFVLWDISSIYSNSKSLAKGEESELAQIIDARVVLCRSELDSWERIHDSLCRGISSAERSQEILNRPFYPAD